jgi:glycosyltransferase involved in cell wall biosynthesis
MKLAILANAFLHDPTTGVNGTQVQNCNLAAAFARQGMEVHYLAMTRDDARPEVEEYEGMSIHWLRPAGSLFGYLSENRAYLRILDELRPDALYNRGRSALTCAAARWARKNGARFVWGSNGEDSCDFFKRLDRLRRSDRPLWKKAAYLPHELLLDLMIHRGVRGARAVVNQTEHQRERLKENYGKDGIVLPSYFLPPETSDIEKQKYVLWLANFSELKQPEKFIELAASMDDAEDWVFILAGGTQDKAYEKRIRDRAELAPRLRTTGPVSFSEARELIEKASLIVSTSAWEGLSNVIIQGWLSGTPVATLQHDPNNWIMERDIGFCAAGDMGALAQWTSKVLHDPARLAGLSRRCREFALREFASPSTIDAYLRLFGAEAGERIG